MGDGWLPALRQVLETKTLSIGGGGAYYGGRYGRLPRINGLGQRDAAAGWDMDTVVQEGYERVVWVYKAVEIIAGNASRLPFQITKGDDTVEKHPLLKVMNKRANPLETGRAFRKRLSAQILLNKTGAFVEVTQNRRGQITRLDLLDPSRVRIIPDLTGDYIKYFEFTRPDGLVRNLDPSRVRWIREPHPLDPFSGVTPLEAAGMSVELDRLAREYNVSFINRDGRPGGIVGVDTEGLPDTELDRIAKLFKPGAQHAGNVTAIGVGKGGMNYVDTSAKPRDMAYETTSEKAKREILAAFGVPESIAGNASERTFDNAEQEEYNFWHDPMLPHLDLIAAAFDDDIDEELDCGFDTSKVEALELPERRRRAEMRDEFDKGLISLDEYRDGSGREQVRIPQSRAFWMSPAKAPVPGQPGDEAALGITDPNAAGGGAEGGDDGGAPGAPAAPETATEAVAQARADAEAAGLTPGESAEPEPVGPAAAAVESARAETSITDDEFDDTGAGSAAVARARMETKQLPADDQPTVHAYAPDAAEERTIEAAVSGALQAILNRQAAVIAARLEAPKWRRGTAYWVPENENDQRGGEAPIDTVRVVDPPRWSSETYESLLPLVTSASRESAIGLLTAMAAAGSLVGAVPVTAAVVGRTAAAAAATSDEIAMAAAQFALAPAMLALATATNAIEAWEQERIADIDHLLTEQTTPDLPALISAVKELWSEKAPKFAQSVAVTVAQTAVVGARDNAAASLTPQVVTPTADSGSYMVEVPPHVLRTWRTRHDEDVRATHREAEGQTVEVGEDFNVGGYDIPYPSYPLAPASISRWCRCWIDYTWSAGAKFTVERNPRDEEAAA